MSEIYDDYMVKQAHELLSEVLRQRNNHQLPVELHMAKRLLDVHVKVEEKPCGCSKYEVELAKTPEDALIEAAKVFDSQPLKQLTTLDVSYALRRMAWRIHALKDDNDGGVTSSTIPIK